MRWTLSSDSSCYVISDCNVANIDVVALYLLERLNDNLYYTLEKLTFFSSYIYIYIFFLFALFCKSEKEFIKCSHEREEGKFPDGQIFHFVQSLENVLFKVWKTHITSFWIIIIVFSLYNPYKTLWIFLTFLSWYSFWLCLVNLSKSCQI